MTAGGGGTLSGVAGSCRLLYEAQRRSTNSQLTLPAGMSSSAAATMFIDPDPLCPSHGHLCRTQQRPRLRATSATHRGLLLPLDRWDCVSGDAVASTRGGGRAEMRCPGCDQPFAAAADDVCHCDCARPDVAVVARSSTMPSPPPPDVGGGSAAGSSTPPPVTDDLKLQKTRRRKSAAAGMNSASAAARRQSAAMSHHPVSDGVSLSAAATARAGQRAGEVEPLLVTGGAAPYEDYDDDAGDDDDDDVRDLTSPPKVISNNVCRSVSQRTDISAGDVTGTAA